MSEDLVLHWAIGRKVLFEWTEPDDKFLPLSTKKFGDGKACQTTFIKDVGDRDFRTIHIEF